MNSWDSKELTLIDDAFVLLEEMKRVEKYAVDEELRTELQGLEEEYQKEEEERERLRKAEEARWGTETMPMNSWDSKELTSIDDAFVLLEEMKRVEKYAADEELRAELQELEEEYQKEEEERERLRKEAEEEEASWGDEGYEESSEGSGCCGGVCDGCGESHPSVSDYSDVDYCDHCLGDD